MKMFLLVVALALALVWLVLRRHRGRTETPDRRALPSAAPDTSYHAVSIRFEKRACDAAREYEGRRLLAVEAPKLPLPDCDAAECNCRFVHYKDRRSGKDRRSPFGSGGISATPGRFEPERREGKERREDTDPF